MTLALRWARRRALLEAADDVARRALTLFRRGCTWVATRHLPGGGHAMVVVGNDRDVHRAGALRGRAQLGENQRLELGSCPRRLVRHDPLLARNVAALEKVNRRIRCTATLSAPRVTKEATGPRNPVCWRGRICRAMSAHFGFGALAQNDLRGPARRGASSRRLGIGIRPSRWACFRAALRARRTASAFSRVLRSDGFS